MNKKEQFKLEITGTMQEIIDHLEKIEWQIKCLKEIENENYENNEKIREYLKNEKEEI